MDNATTTKTLLARRKQTRTIGHILSERMRAYVATLTPLFRQRTVFGIHIQGGGSEQIKSADLAFKELQAVYEKVATAVPFNLPRDLDSPLMQMTSSLELSPWEYVHVANTGGESKAVTVTCPFKSSRRRIGHREHRAIRNRRVRGDRQHRRHRGAAGSAERAVA